jgi:hypothetical protein
MKYNHNKKRNTALIYEVLINELTKATLNDNSIKREKIVGVLKKFFSKGKILAKELEIYKSLTGDTLYESRSVVEKIIIESKKQFKSLDRKQVFNEQTKLINKINKNISKDIWQNYIPSFKKNATANQILQSELSPKKQVMMESKLVKSLVTPAKTDEKFPKVNNLAMKTFITKFNEKYSRELNDTQREFLNKYIMSHVDSGLEFKMYMYEEISRLKTVLEEGCTNKDKDTQVKIQKVLDKISNYNKKKLDKESLYEIFKIQMLVSEISK